MSGGVRRRPASRRRLFHLLGAVEKSGKGAALIGVQQQGQAPLQLSDQAAGKALGLTDVSGLLEQRRQGFVPAQLLWDT
ncbi:hypothetical protein DFAR_1430014 [Desulfarculales bacterium]